MVFNKRKTYVLAFFGAVFFTFSGYYALLILSNNLLGPQFSRYITIPIRLFLILLLAVCLWFVGKKKNLDLLTFGSFFAFSFLYIMRIVLEILKGSTYHMSNESFLLYFLAFGFIPFVLLYLKEDLELDRSLYKSAILISGALLALFTIFFYRDIIGTVGRISLAISRGDNYISPLALSYSGSLTMGVALTLLLTDKIRGMKKVFLLSAAGLACVPFFLGASRGSVMALIIPFMMLVAYQKNKLTSFYLAILMVFAGGLLVTLSSYFGSNVIDRFMNIGEGIESGGSSAARLDIWTIALDHFMKNPLIGYGLESPETGNYPHNILVEVLLTTGILGFIPFAFLTWKGISKSLYIFKNAPHSSWIAIIYLECLVQNQFSGGIYTASWLWFSLAFVLTTNFQVAYMRDRSPQREASRMRSMA